MTRAIERLVVCGVDGERSGRRAAGTISCATRSSRRRQEPADDGDGDGAALPQDPGRAPRQASRSTQAPRAALLPPWLTHEGRRRRPRARRSRRQPVDDRRGAAACSAQREARRRALRRGNARASADAVAAGHSAGGARRGGAALPRAAGHGFQRGRARGDRRSRCWRCSTTRASRRCSRPAAAPKCRSSAPPPGPRRVRPGRPPGGDAGRRADRRLQDQSAGAAPRIEDAPADLCPPARALPRGAVRLYPGRPVRAALVWTDTPDLMEIPAAELDAALGILTSA